MKLLRNLIYAIVLLLFLIAGIFPRYRRHDVLKGFWTKMKGAVPAIPAAARVAWIHAAGIGELMLCQPVIERLRTQHVDLTFAITVFDGEALAVAKSIFPNDHVALAPYDFTWAVRRARLRIHPSLFLIAENDIWPNLISEIGESHIPILIFNSRMTLREQKEHRWNGWLIRPALRHVSWWGAVQKEDAQWIETLFDVRMPPVEIMGTLKLDGISRAKASPNIQNLKRWWGFKEAEQILVAGSTHAPEEETILTVYEQLQPLHPQLRLILVPRNSARFEEVAQLMTHRGISFVKVSDVSQPVLYSSPVTLADSVGQLRDIWGLADLGFVGGSLSNHGGHNVVEPASYAVPICFGPYVDNIRVIADELLSHQAAVQVTSGDECRRIFQHWLDHPKVAADIGKRAQELVTKDGGPLATVLRAIDNLLSRDCEAAPELPNKYHGTDRGC